MATERGPREDQDVAFELGERHFAKEKSGTKPATKNVGVDDEPRRVPRDRKEIPVKPLAERGRRGA